MTIKTQLMPIVYIMLCFCGFAQSGLVNLNPDDKGDRIAVVKDGKVAYLPAKRVNIGSRAVGGGHCRYIKRLRNGDLYVTGPGLGLFRSTDGGHHWTQLPLGIEGMAFMSAFTILNDDTFLISYMPPPRFEHKRMLIARSTDYGKTWESDKLEPDISPCKYMLAWNADMIQLDDGTVLHTIDTRVGPDGVHDENGKELPVQLKTSFLYVIRSNDSGRTWGEKSLLPGYGGEAHLLKLPSGKVMACVRKQRNNRMPGDPASVLALKKRYGYDPAIGGGIVEDGDQGTRIKNMFVSESYDGGYTWVNEQQVSGFMQCSGDMSYLEDGTLVLQYLHRYKGGPAADISIRARVSYDDGKTWEPEEYILSDGENYPGGIAVPGGGMISMVPHRGHIQALHWRPLPKYKPTLAYQKGTIRPRQPSAPSFDPESGIEVIADGRTMKRPATRSDILIVPPGSRHSAIRYGRNSSIIQRSRSGALYCAGSILGQYMMVSQDEGRTWRRLDLDIQGWGEPMGFKILRDGDFLVVYEPVGGGHRGLYTARSNDEGKTWSVAMAKLSVAPFTHVSGKDNNVIELSDGTLVMAVQLWGGRDESGPKAPGGQDAGPAHTLRSTDGGKTWIQRAPICGLVGKSRLISLQSGKLLACVQSIKAGPYNKFYIAESVDGGITWTNPREAFADLKPTTASLTQLADGPVVLQFVYDAQPGTSAHNSWYSGGGMRAVVSNDEGKTWQKQTYILSRIYADGAKSEGWGAYLGDTVELAGGRLLTTCVGAVGPGPRFSAVVWKP